MSTPFSKGHCSLIHYVFALLVLFIYIYIIICTKIIYGDTYHALITNTRSNSVKRLVNQQLIKQKKHITHIIHTFMQACMRACSCKTYIHILTHVTQMTKERYSGEYHARRLWQPSSLAQIPRCHTTAMLRLYRLFQYESVQYYRHYSSCYLSSLIV